MKTIIAGSRSSTYEQTRLAIILAVEDGLDITEVVSGTARGSDSHGEIYARYMDIPVKKFPADWNKYGNKAGVIRNKEMAEYAETAVIAWNGLSRGTKHMMNFAEEMGLKTYIYNYGR
jgi:hypothetical protein